MPETFSPATWADGPGGGTPITAAQLNRIENGVESMDDRITAVEDAAVTSTTIDTIVTLTQTAYDALGTPDSRTLYVITGP